MKIICRPLPQQYRIALPFLRLMKIPGFQAWTSLRNGGVSSVPFDSLNLGLNTQDQKKNVVQNRNIFFDHLKLSVSRSVYMQQIHSAAIVRVGIENAGWGFEEHGTAVGPCDAMMTDQSLFLNVGTADCLALGIVHPQKRITAVAHCGWRGALAMLASNLLQQMCRVWSLNPQDCLAGLSVCLGPEDLELGPEQYEQFQRKFSADDMQKFSMPGNDGHFKLNLWNCIMLQLMQSGMKQENMEVQNHSTLRESRLFSYRRDQGNTGRMMSLFGFSLQ